ncbi:MAG TPA: Eco57I restriction-modification methylase domain-containing protein [Terriglobales bacterium]|nr:Eco57I restriction-modification methylase domain-containing protein [Terriglobales bacterium]
MAGTSTALDCGLLRQVESLRLSAGGQTSPDQKSKLGQFLTPAPVAVLMASMLEHSAREIILLDPGAGVGSLFAAVVSAAAVRQPRLRSIRVTAFELDPSLIAPLRQTMAACSALCNATGIRFDGEVREEDFLAFAADELDSGLFSKASAPRFNCAILNPPYRKIHAASKARRLISQLGVETSNLYAGFVAATTTLLEPGGELVAITPRSFCNGPYFEPFRKNFLETMSLRRLHVFASRKRAFRDDAVLQENIIYHAVKAEATPDKVRISSSEGPEDDHTTSRRVPFGQVVRPGDKHAFIHIPADEMGHRAVAAMTQLPSNLGDLAMKVSTGRVVDFRARSSLRMAPAPGTAPLLYPCHFAKGDIVWPQATRKPNAIKIGRETEALLVPSEPYVLVKRFSSKEETKRIVATVFDPNRVLGSQIGFENHLNYFYGINEPLTLRVARGLAVFLNSTMVDAYFRQFNGHTQVNASDLRSLRYPNREQLERLGDIVPIPFPDQSHLDDLVESIIGKAKERANQPHPSQAKNPRGARRTGRSRPAARPTK